MRDRATDQAKEAALSAGWSGLREKYLAKVGSVSEINRSLASVRRLQQQAEAEFRKMPECDRLHAEHAFRDLIDREFHDVIVALRIKKKQLS